MTSRVAPAVPIVLLGPGRVGRAVVQRIIDDREALAARLGLRLEVAAVADRSGVVQPLRGGLADDDLRDLLAFKAAGGPLTSWRGTSVATDTRDVIDPKEVEALGAAPILVDATAADTSRSLLDARSRGWRLVLANKVPLTDSMDTFRRVTDYGRGARWETTVASSLPVIATLQSLLDQGDRVRWISGSLSGTLGVVCRALEHRERFSDAVRSAIRDGMAEPDPRGDLSGQDVARKALILARMLDYDLSLPNVALRGLLPADWFDLDREEALSRLPELDDGLAGWVRGQPGTRLRFLATIGEGRVRARLVAVDAASPLARADAADSAVAFETDGFRNHPLVLSGRGGGPAATALGVMGDIVSLAREKVPPPPV